MMTAVLGFVCLVVGVLIGLGVGSKQHIPDPSPAPTKEAPLPDPAPRQEAPKTSEPGTRPASKDAPDANGQDPLEDLKLVLHSLLTMLTEVADSMQTNSDSYDAQLVTQRDELAGASTLQDMQRLGAVLLKHIETMHRSNAENREQLTTTRALLKQQQDEVERLQRETSTDFLTNLPNRQAYEERIRETINIARRYGNIFSLLVMDIDNFKSINDEFGHLAGDNVLRDLAGLVKSSSRVSDFFARYGGEEFTYILPQTTMDQAAVLAEKLRKQVEEYEFTYDDVRMPVTISGGIAQVSREGETADELFKRADAALYQAKERGRNRIECGD